MSDDKSTVTDDQKSAEDQAGGGPAADPIDEWKPEPRSWSWKDLFTAPMLAFKPKAVGVSVVTMFAISLIYWLFGQISADIYGTAFVGPVLAFIKYLCVGVVFGLGATLVAVFMKADLLDDEFLSVKEAIGQYKGRLQAAALVPAFLMVVVAGFNLLVWLGTLVGSIPWIGPILYGILYPLGWLVALFAVLLAIGVFLGFFLFPGIVAVRKHGWFDNVIDTFEAVGTRPHVVVASGVITILLIAVAGGIVGATTAKTERMGYSEELLSDDIQHTHREATPIATGWADWLSNPSQENYDSAGRSQYDLVGAGSGVFRGLMFSNFFGSAPRPIEYSEDRMESLLNREEMYEKRLESGNLSEQEYQNTKNTLEDVRKQIAYLDPGFGPTIGGFITGIWKLLINLFLLGYLVNIFIGAGLLTYLNVREDDYWDDEDLEDLDQLAKELEEEAQAELAKEREQEGADADKTVAAGGTAATEAGATVDEAAQTQPDEEADSDKDSTDAGTAGKAGESDEDKAADQQDDDKKDDETVAKDDQKDEDETKKPGDDEAAKKDEDEKKDEDDEKKS